MARSADAAYTGLQFPILLYPPLSTFCLTNSYYVATIFCASWLLDVLGLLAPFSIGVGFAVNCPNGGANSCHNTVRLIIMAALGVEARFSFVIASTRISLLNLRT